MLSTSSGYGYDATGNLTAGPGFSYATYDVQNRMATYVPTSGGTEYYSYGPENMRVWKKPPSLPEEVYFYGAQGEKLGRFNYGTGVFTTLRRSIYFGARVISEGQDRLGSVPDHGGYYPYGEAQTAGFNDQDRFATYYRDGTSLLDYARNRYYSSTLGRFMSADPYISSTGLGDPGSWNRYSYTRNDPVNRVDPFGLDDCTPSPGIDFCVTGTDTGSGEGGGSTIDPSLLRFQLHFSPTPGTPADQRPGNRTTPILDRNRLRLISSKVNSALSHSDCLSIFGTAPPLGSGLFGAGATPTPSQIFQSIVAGGTYGSIVFGAPDNPGANAQTKPSVLSTRMVLSTGQIVFTNNVITINNSRDPRYDGTDMWNFGSFQDDGLTLLHEMGHVLANMGWTGGQFNNDDGNSIINRVNNQLIQGKCERYLY